MILRSLKQNKVVSEKADKFYQLSKWQKWLLGTKMGKVKI